MKVATCTPFEFEGNSRFFTRDSGLLCRGFQSIGIDCIAIMPGVSHTSEPADLLRCTKEQLASVDWWKSQNLDLVVLYAWGNPRYLAVAKSIRRAGIQLVQNLDAYGMYSPYTGFARWLKASYSAIMIPSGIKGVLVECLSTLRSFIPSLFDLKRLNMLAECDLLATVSIPAMESIKSYVSGFNRTDIADKMVVIPHPVSPLMAYNNEVKSKKVIAVGRWGANDRAQKDPKLTIQVIIAFLAEHPDWNAEIIGSQAGELAPYLKKVPRNIRDRLKLTEHLDHHSLRSIYAESRILFCGSRHESFHIASAEAVCYGCSVVCANVPLLASTTWFSCHESGTLANSRKKQDLVLALEQETSAWEQGQRSPEQISSYWIKRLAVASIANDILIKSECVESR